MLFFGKKNKAATQATQDESALIRPGSQSLDRTELVATQTAATTLTLEELVNNLNIANAPVLLSEKMAQSASYNPDADYMQAIEMFVSNHPGSVSEERLAELRGGINHSFVPSVSANSSSDSASSPLGQLIGSYGDYASAVRSEIDALVKSDRPNHELAIAIENTRNALANVEASLGNFEMLMRDTGMVEASFVADINRRVDELLLSYSALKSDTEIKPLSDILGDDRSLSALRAAVQSSLSNDSNSAQSQNNNQTSSQTVTGGDAHASQETDIDVNSSVSNNGSQQESIVTNSQSSSSGSGSVTSVQNSQSVSSGSVSSPSPQNSNPNALFEAKVDARRQAIARDLGGDAAAEFNEWYEGLVASGQTPSQGQIDHKTQQLQNQANGIVNEFAGMDNLPGVQAALQNTPAHESTLNTRAQAIRRDYGSEAYEEFMSWMEDNPNASVGQMDSATESIISDRPFIDSSNSGFDPVAAARGEIEDKKRLRANSGNQDDKDETPAVAGGTTATPGLADVTAPGTVYNPSDRDRDGDVDWRDFAGTAPSGGVAAVNQSGIDHSVLLQGQAAQARQNNIINQQGASYAAELELRQQAEEINNRRVAANLTERNNNWNGTGINGASSTNEVPQEISQLSQEAQDIYDQWRETFGSIYEGVEPTQWEVDQVVSALQRNEEAGYMGTPRAANGVPYVSSSYAAATDRAEQRNHDMAVVGGGTFEDQRAMREAKEKAEDQRIYTNLTERDNNWNGVVGNSQGITDHSGLLQAQAAQTRKNEIINQQGASYAAELELREQAEEINNRRVADNLTERSNNWNGTGVASGGQISGSYNPLSGGSANPGSLINDSEGTGSVQDFFSPSNIPTSTNNPFGPQDTTATLQRRAQRYIDDLEALVASSPNGEVNPGQLIELLESNGVTIDYNTSDSNAEFVDPVTGQVMEVLELRDSLNAGNIPSLDRNGNGPAGFAGGPFGESVNLGGLVSSGKVELPNSKTARGADAKSVHNTRHTESSSNIKDKTTSLSSVVSGGSSVKSQVEITKPVVTPTQSATSKTNPVTKSATVTPTVITPTSKTAVTKPPVAAVPVKTSPVVKTTPVVTKLPVATTPAKTTPAVIKPAATPIPASVTTTVQSGDGWYALANRNGVSVDAILKANNATLNTVIHPGQKITVPVSSSGGSLAPTVTNPSGAKTVSTSLAGSGSKTTNTNLKTSAAKVQNSYTPAPSASKTNTGSVIPSASKKTSNISSSLKNLK